MGVTSFVHLKSATRGHLEKFGKKVPVSNCPGPSLLSSFACSLDPILSPSPMAESRGTRLACTPDPLQPALCPHWLRMALRGVKEMLDLCLPGLIHLSDSYPGAIGVCHRLHYLPSPPQWITLYCHTPCPRGFIATPLSTWGFYLLPPFQSS